MESKALKELMIFDELEATGDLSQRNLASKLDVSLGLVNSILKRFVRKGYMKASSVPGNRIKYLLTPKGAAEKTRLTYLYIKYSISLYKCTYSSVREVFERLYADNQRNVVFCGVSEIAEVAMIVAKDIGIEVVAVFDDNREGENFMGETVSALSKMPGFEYDRVIMTDQYAHCDDLKELGVPLQKITTF